MHFKLYKILSNISELLMLFAAKRIDLEQLHNYIIADIDMFIRLNTGIFGDVFTPSLSGNEDRKEDKV